MSGIIVGAAGAGIAFAVYRYMCSAKTPKSLKLTYFDISAAPGEKVRLALKLLGIPFEDSKPAAKKTRVKLTPHAGAVANF